MEQAKLFLEKKGAAADGVSGLTFAPHKPHSEYSFYEDSILRGIRVDRVQRDSIYCSFKVPPRLTDSDGNLAKGAIASLVDELGAAVILEAGQPMMCVSVDMSISYISDAKMNDELEIISRLLGWVGDYSGTNVTIRKKTTGEVVAEGRHSLFTKRASKL